VIRHCDGKDRNLIRKAREGEVPTIYGGYVPCDCGRVFDDVELTVIGPEHYPV
jgi:hypothetical protein